MVTPRPDQKKRRVRRPGEFNREALRLGDVGPTIITLGGGKWAPFSGLAPETLVNVALHDLRCNIN